jgi:hypothetical protein
MAAVGDDSNWREVHARHFPATGAKMTALMDDGNRRLRSTGAAIQALRDFAGHAHIRPSSPFLALIFSTHRAFAP